MQRSGFLLCSILALVLTVFGGEHSSIGKDDHAGGNDEPRYFNCSTKENCTDQFQNVVDCLMGAFKQSEERLKEQFEANDSKLKECLTKNKCTVPTSSSDPQAQKKAQCMKAAMEKGKQLVEECVKEKLPNIQMPHIAFNFSERPPMHPQQLSQRLNESCQGGDEKGFRECANNVWRNDKSVKTNFQKFCKDDGVCLQKLTKGCECQFFQVKAVAEMCIMKTMFKMMNSTNELPECEGLPRPPPPPKPEQQGPNANGTHHEMPQQGPPHPMQSAAANKNLCGNLQQYQDENFSYDHKGQPGMHGPSHP